MSDKIKMSFVTPVFQDGNSVGKMIESLLDQDFKNWEQILIDDGSKDSSWKVISKYVKKYPNKIRGIKLQQNGGVCHARNEGAKLATGEYLSFLPADAQLFPGMLRIWVEKLDAEKQYDFLYGGYKFIDENDNPMGDYVSEAFDPYQLEMYNFIDGSFPLRRELFDKIGGWDENCKSLNDWEFWLRAVKNYNAKGLYIADIFFKTTLPHPGGLSYDSAQNWVARNEYIKTKLGVPNREICVTSHGAVYHAKNVAKMLNADYKDSPAFKPHNYKMIYLIGCYYSMFPNIVEAFKKHEGLRVAHWIGSDIYQLQQLKAANSTQSDISLDFFLKYLSHNIDVHYCEFEPTRKELLTFGINARICPLPPQNEYDIMPLPDKFSIAIYDPYINKGFYLPDITKGLAKNMPEVEFNFFGDDTWRGDKNNIHHLGHLDNDGMKELIKKSSAIMRLVPHDGLPLSVVEFLEAGRNAITTTPMKYVLMPADLKEETLKTAVNECKNKPLNEDGSKYYKQLMDKNRFKETIYGLMNYDIKKYWDDRARSWDIIRGDVIDNEYLPVIEKFINEIKPISVLDIGAGNGNYSQWLGVKINKYTGLDICKELIDKAKQRYPQYNFICEDLFNYTVEKPYDLIFTFTTLLHIKPEDMERAAAKLKTLGKYGIFIEPVIKLDKNGIVERRLHPELMKEITENQKLLQGLESSFIHNYEKYFEVIKKELIGQRAVYLVKLQ